MASNEPSTENNPDAVVAASAVTTRSTSRHPFRCLSLPFFHSFISSTRANPPAKTSYHYEPLDPRGNEVRLLTLLPGRTSAELRVSLSIVPFQVQSPPTFEALSYVWGSTENPDFVTVGETGNDAIAVTQNLAIALTRLRYRDQPRTLWVDAICVNQKDLAERSQQVQLMGNIYGSAARVIGWLGPETHDSSLALTVLQAIGTSFEVDWRLLTAEPATGNAETHFTSKSTATWQGALSKTQSYAVKSLLSRPYFQRLWIHQEIRLAKCHTAVIACGLAQLSWNVFRRAIFVLDRDLIPRPIFDLLSELSAYFDCLEGVISLCLPLNNYNLFSYVHEVSQCLCSDPRDRVFALLSMYERANPSFRDRLDIHPDYDAPVSQLYQEVTRQDIYTRRRLDVLRDCELRQDNPHSLPTWVPDLSRPHLAYPAQTSNAAGFTTPDFEFCASNVLRVRGIPMCSLKTAQSFQFGERTQDSIIRLLRQMRPSMSLNNAYVTGCTYLDAYCDALSCGEFVDSSVPPFWEQQRGASTDILRMIWTTEMDYAGFTDAVYHAPAITVADVTKFFSTISACCDYRKLCTTEEGYVALAPPSARPGDRISVLLGCPCPMLLRPDGDRWRVVGECYVPGLEAGEALAGPLPQGYRAVRVYYEAVKAWYKRFQNISTEQILTDDPRFDISEYPEVGSVVDWDYWNSEERAWKKGPLRITRNDADARLEYPWREENLVKRGVQLRDFYLV